MEHKLKQFSTATSEEKTGHKLHEQKLPSGNCYKFNLKRHQIFINNSITRLFKTLYGKLYNKIRLRIKALPSLTLSNHIEKKKEAKAK